MSMSGDEAYVLAMDYVDETLEGGGALKGADGKSAYQSWLDLGNTGTEQDFINSLKGANGKDGTDGQPGEKGADGKSAYQYAKDGGYTGTETEFTTNIARSGVISKELEVERARIDNLTTLQDGSTTGDAELIDARIDKDGNIYVNVGKHIRTVTSQLSSEIDDVKETLVKSELTKIIDLQDIKNTGKFITDNGTLEDNEAFSYSNHIFIPKGKLISFFARGYYNSVSMIAEYHNIDTQYAYTPLVKCGNDNEDKLYHYITTKDMMIAFCWETVTEPTLTITDILTNNYERYVTNDYISMFHKIAGIGDSLMSGCLCSDDETRVEDCYEYSWLSSIARNHGLEKVHYSHGGYTAKDWSEGGYVSQMQEDSFDAIFIGLGTNDKNQSYPLGTLTDTSDTNSFVGYYTKILEQIRAYHLNTPIFCLSLYDKSTQTAIEYSDMIRRIANIHDNCYFVDVANLSDVLVYDATYTSGYHFTTVGYIRLAKNIERIVNQIVDEHRNDFKLFGLPTN